MGGRLLLAGGRLLLIRGCFLLVGGGRLLLVRSRLLLIGGRLLLVRGRLLLVGVGIIKMNLPLSFKEVLKRQNVETFQLFASLGFLTENIEHTNTFMMIL